MDSRQVGVVKWFNNRKGYGFIALEGNVENDVFVHHTSIEEEGYRSLVEGQRVEFILQDGPKGPAAASVQKVMA